METITKIKLLEEQQNKNWKELSNNQKDETIKNYIEARKIVENDTKKTGIIYLNEKIIEAIVDTFGLHNLQPRLPDIKIWSNMEEVYEEIDTTMVELDFLLIDNDIELELKNKIVSLFQIHHLIDISYGGAITNEDWKDHSKDKWCINWRDNKWEFAVHNTSRHPIAFHTKEYMDEFMSFPQNVKLIKEFYQVY